MSVITADDRPSTDNTVEDPAKRSPLVIGHDFTSVTDKICGIVEKPKTPRAWYIAFAVSSAVATMFMVLIGYLVFTGIGVWGVQIPVGWGFAIINFVFWVGIGHAGTLISAILFLFRQRWRTSINRFAEGMTIFAVICAGIYPGIHVGRVWLAYWMFPVPNQMEMWPNFRSPLLWDVFAVSTYFTVSLLFWYLGMVPDIATLRDRATTKIKQIAYSIFSLGWTGANRQWQHYERAYLLLAALATPLVLSVHSVVSFDFAVSQLPGWHTTIFPPYFVAGAIFSGFAMVVMLAVPVREWFGLKHIITLRHLENMNKIILATGSMVGYAYFVEFFIAWYSGNPFEHFTFLNRALGPYSWAYWIMVTCNVITPQLFWSKKIRTEPWVMFIIVIFVNVGMWFERFVIIVTSLSRDFLPSSWGYYTPTWVDWGMLIGSFGLFFTLFLLFVRFLPIVAMAELKSVMPQAHTHGEDRETDPRIVEADVAEEPAHAAGDESEAAAGAGGPYGLMVEFETPDRIMSAARRTRDAGFKRWDVYSPFPVHGMDRAMGLRDTPLSWLVLAGGATGALGGLFLQWWTNAKDYPLLISGKPLWSLPANIPVAFELTILLAALAAVGGLLMLTRLPRFRHPVLKSKYFRRMTSDRFALCIESTDPGFDSSKTSEFLASLGGTAVERVEA
jgi:molybdopterin-containing oxidoreductase family membrane subunit